MNVRLRFPAFLLAAAASALAVPAIAAEVVEVRTAPAGVYHYTSPSGIDYYYDPVTRTYHYYTADTTAPRITVEAAPLTEDEAINHDVMGALASDSRLEGRIGVETLRNEVNLSGRLGSQRQIDIAENTASNVPGVREVHSSLRPWGQQLSR
jgi:hypothetical protein